MKHQKTVRLSVDCTEQERMFIKMLAAKNNMTISEYLLSFARKQMPRQHSQEKECSYEPNQETALVLRESDEGKNLIEPESLDAFWDSLGLK